MESSSSPSLRPGEMALPRLPKKKLGIVSKKKDYFMIPDAKCLCDSKSKLILSTPPSHPDDNMIASRFPDKPSQIVILIHPNL
jgi:hypothetical protein